MTASGVEQPIETLPFHAGGNVRSQLDNLLTRLGAQFSEIAMVDLTTREFAGLGVSAVKVVVPQAAPLHPDHRFPWLGNNRLCQDRAGTLNRFPHPFS
jgi:ribosomal protein S12 methylthiotransferase accessory factor